MIQDIVTIQLLGDSKGYLDVEEGTAFPIIYAAAEIRDVSSKSGNTSKVVKLADTPNNHKLLNYYFEVNTVAGTFDINKAVQCMVLRNGVPVMDNCVFQLTLVNKMQENSNDEQHATYDAVVKDQTSYLFTKIGNAELTDLNLNDLNHIYNSTNVIASFSNTQADGYKYLMPLNDTAVFNLNDFRPTVYAKTYFDRSLAAAGFSYEWDEQTNEETQFDKLVIPYNGDVPQVRQEISDNYLVEATKTTTQTLTGTGSSGSVAPCAAAQITIPNEVTDVHGDYNNATSVYTSPLYYLGGGNISFELSVEWELAVNNTTGATAYLVANSPSLNFGVDYRPRMYLGKNGSLTSAGVSNLYTIDPAGFIHKAGGYSIPAGETIIGGSTTDISFAGTLTDLTTTYRIASAVGVNAGVMKWRNANSTAGTLVAVNTVLRIKSISMKIQPSMSELGYGQTVYMNDFIPKKIKQSDFIKSIFTHHNIMVSVDQFNSNKLILKSRNKFYDDGVNVDWRLKLCKEKPQQEVFLPSLITKKLQLSFKPDNDKPNTDYLEATNETYGQVEFTFDSEHVKGLEREELIFSPTPVTINDTLNAVVPMIVGVAPKNNIRLLYDGGELTCNSYTIVDYVNSSGTSIGTTQTSYPLLSHFDKAKNPTFDIMFAPCDFYYYDFGNKTNNTAYNLRWRRTLSQMNTGKMLIAYFDLDEYDISKMRLSDKIQVGNAWYNINKVEYNAADVEPTKVELITVDTDLSFVPFKARVPSLPSKGDTVLASIRDVISRTKEFANVILTASVMTVRGVNNVVGQSVKSGAVYGDNNVVNTEKVMIVGSGVTAEEDGVYTPLIVFPDGTRMQSTDDVVSTNFFTENQTEQAANRVHQSNGYNVALKTISGLALNDDVLSGTMFRVYYPSGNGIDVYVTAGSSRGLNVQCDGTNGYGMVASAGVSGGTGIKGFGDQYGGIFSSNAGAGKYAIYTDSASGNGIFSEGSSLFRNVSAAPSSGYSYRFVGYGTSSSDWVLQVSNSSFAELLAVRSDGALFLQNLPTSSTGLASGGVYQDDNGDGTSTLKIVN